MTKLPPPPPPPPPPAHLSRYAGTALTLGGLLTRVLMDQAGVSTNHEAYAATLTQGLGHLRGPLMKIAQILATVPDVLPPAYAEAFLDLQAHAPAMGWLFVQRRLRAELGEDWSSLFQMMEPQATFAASLGQVHRAVTTAGVAVACKIQYPDMESVVAQDLGQLALLCRLYEGTGGAVLTKALQQEISERLREELDYTQEARHIAWFQAALTGEEGVHLPTVMPELSTSRLLTMTWMEGDPFLSAAEAPQEDRNLLGRRLFRAWWRPFYQAGMIHGDPHLGNYTVTPDFGLNLLDFGCIRVFPPPLVAGVIRLFEALLHQNREAMVVAYRAWGFEDLDEELIDALSLWARFLYGPLLEDRVRPIEETFSGEAGKHIAGHVHEILRKRGGIAPPREFVFLDRAAVGIGSALIRLRAQENWHRLFLELTEHFSESAVADHQHAVMGLST